MDTLHLHLVKAIGDEANAAVVAHLNRAPGYVGLTLNERDALARLDRAIAALEGEVSFTTAGTAV
jgi:hypothetical protein